MLKKFGFILLLSSVVMGCSAETNEKQNADETDEVIQDISDTSEYKKEHLELVTKMHLLFKDSLELHKSIAGSDANLTNEGYRTNFKAINDELLTSLASFKDILGDLPRS